MQSDRYTVCDSTVTPAGRMLLVRCSDNKKKTGLKRTINVYRRLVVGTVGHDGFRHAHISMTKHQKEMTKCIVFVGTVNVLLLWMPSFRRLFSLLFKPYIHFLVAGATWNHLKRVEESDPQAKFLCGVDTAMVAGSPPNCTKFQGQGAFS